LRSRLYEQEMDKQNAELAQARKQQVGTGRPQREDSHLYFAGWHGIYASQWRGRDGNRGADSQQVAHRG